MTKDTTRQVVVLISAVLAVAGSVVGSGALGGTSIQNAAGGALAADATRIAPGGPAFSIWTVIYLGLIGFAVWQLLPAHRDDERQRLIGYPVAGSMLLNAAWILTVQFDLLLVSVLVIAALLIDLVRIFVILLRTAPRSRLETVLVDGTIGLYLGWVCVATAANLTAVLVDQGFDGFGIDPDLWAVAVIAVAGAIGIAVALRSRGRLAPALSLAWGLAWVAVARLTGAPSSAPAAIAAISAAAAVLLVTLIWRLRPLPVSR